MKNRKNKYIITIVILSIVLVGLLYLSFFSFSKLRKMGYKNKDIYHMVIYNISDKVDSYNQSLLYAFDSKFFVKENIDYYLLVNSEFDFTAYMNSLASKYDFNKAKEIVSILNNDQLIDFINSDVVKNLDLFKKLKLKNYALNDCVEIANNLSDESIESFLSIDGLTVPTNYLKYLETGYNDETILAIYNRLGDEGFNDLSIIAHYSDLKDYINDDKFEINNLPRYLMYGSQNDISTSEVVRKVDLGEDIIDSAKLDYTSFYQNEVEVRKLESTTLVNKSHKLVGVQVSNLVDLDGSYRGNNQPLVKEVADKFVEMVDYIKQQTNTSFIAYSNYQSPEVVQLNYDKLILACGGDVNSVEAVTSKAGYEEHETGLASDIAEKGSTCSQIEESASYQFLCDHAHEFGFILRYPVKKEFITGTQYTPYHFRYVTTELAGLLHKYNWTLEEYYYLIKG